MEREELLHGPNLQSQCSSAIATLQSDNSALTSLKTTLANFNASGQLKGAGIQGLEQQLNDYTTIIDAELMANESDIADYQTVISAAGDEEINGTQVLDTWDRAKIGKQEAEDAAYSARAWAGFFRLIMQQDTALILEEDARIYDSQGEIWQSIIELCQEKADKFDTTKAATDNLFTGSAALRAVAASGLQDITTAFQGDGYAPNMRAAWRQYLADPKAEKEAATYLFSQGVTKQQLQNMQKLGYSAQEVSEIWKTCKGPEDRKFLSHIMDGTKKSYEEAFRIDPNKLSDGITIFLGPYSMRLLQTDAKGELMPESKEQFEHFNNAILSSEKIYYEKMKDGSLVESGRLYRDIYLERMYISSLAEIEGRAVALALMDPTHPSYDEYYDVYAKDMAVLNLWASEILLVEKMGHASKEEAYQLSMNGLEYIHKIGFSLNVEHYSSYAGNYVEEKLSNDILWESNNIDNTWSRMRLEALAKAKDTLLQNVVGNMILAGGTIAAGAFSPGFGIALSMLVMMGQGKAGNIVGLDSVVDSKLAKLGIKEVNIAGVAFINAFLQWTELSEKMDKENWQQKMEWFGLGGKYTIASGGILEDETGITFANIYSPKMLRGIQVWEESGVAGWLGWDEDLANAIEAEMKINPPSVKTLDGPKKLLKGHETNGERIGIMELTDMAQFEDDIEVIQLAYRKLHKNTPDVEGNLIIQDEWRRFVSGK